MIMQKIKGLIAASFTPFNADGSLNLSVVPLYADKLKKDGVAGTFVCGTTGEGMFMTEEERMLVAEAWVKEQTDDFKVIVHVGTTSARQSQKLAAHAQEIGTNATSCMGPMFLAPSRVSDLVDFCAIVASGAPELPFYYYHIPTVSGVNLSMVAFLKEASKVIPNLNGIKYTNRNAMEMMQCMHLDNGKWDILHGFDEELLMGLTAGAKAAIGSTYNYMSPLYNQIIKTFEAGDLDKALELQFESVKFVEILIKYGGGVAGGKPVMKMVGIDCGPLRAPAHNISQDEVESYQNELKSIGFFG
jgi:N-acetylneuraminate lyase